MTKVTLDPGPFVLPMPALLVGAEVEGKPNFMTAAFCGIVDFKPPKVMAGLNPKHRTCRGIEETGVFSINLPSAELVELTDYCGLYSGDKVDKAELFDVFYGELERAPMIGECALSAECKLISTQDYDVDRGYVAEVVRVHADESALTDGDPDWTKIAPMIFTFPDKAYWRLGDYVAPAWKVGKKKKEE
jgi:flavin reductase (DIM6/NTAB) family NADH-FMN oxidoreductase RutF